MPKQAYITSSGAFKGMGLGKINHEMFKWGQYQPEMLEVLCILKQKINSVLIK
jgi:hypothetical protein